MERVPSSTLLMPFPHVKHPCTYIPSLEATMSPNPFTGSRYVKSLQQAEQIDMWIPSFSRYCLLLNVQCFLSIKR